MRGLDGQARIFIGSSSEGKAAAETTASVLEAAGMRPVLWSDFFKTRDLPLQELDRRMEDADGAILVGSADDRLVSRGKEFDQVRDNVLLEYGLFAGHLGRHRCILLMPDHPRFRIPSDFLGVAGFEFYTEQTLNVLAKKLPERLQAAFAADGFKPPSLQERCRRLLLLSGWMRGEIAKIRLELSARSLKEELGEKIEAILCFLKEDIDTLGLREDATVLEELLRNSIDTFPYVPDRGEVEDQLRMHVGGFLLHPVHLPIPLKLEAAPAGRRPDRLRDELDRLRDKLADMLGYDWLRYERIDALGCPLEFDRGRYWVCPWCGPDQSCLQKRSSELITLPPEDSTFGFLRLIPKDYFPEGVRCVGQGWYMGAIDMLAFLYKKLGEFDRRTISSLERWREDWVPAILDRLGAIEQTVHKQIFGHL